MGIAPANAIINNYQYIINIHPIINQINIINYTLYDIDDPNFDDIYDNDIDNQNIDDIYDNNIDNPNFDDIYDNDIDDPNIDINIIH